MSKRRWYNFYIVLQGSKQWLHGIAASKRTLYCKKTNEDNIQPLQGRKVQLRGYGNDDRPCNNQIFYAVNWNDDGKWAHIARSNDDEHIFNVVLQEKWRQLYFCCCKRQSYCKELAMTMSQPLWDARMQQSNSSYAVVCMDNGNERTLVCHIARSNDNNGWLQLGNARSRHATTNQIFMLNWGSKQQSWNNYIVNALIMSYVESQEATMTAMTVNHDEHVRLRKWQTTLFIDVDQPHRQSQRCEAPAIKLTATPWHNVNNTTIILYCHIPRSNDNTRQMQVKNVMALTQQSNIHVVVCGVQQWPYRTTQWPVAQLCWGWVWQVCQRWRVHCQRHVTCQRQVHWVRQRQHVRCQGQVWGVRQGVCIHRGGPQ